MFRRQTTGSVVCPSCGRLVGVNEAECFNCGRANPGLWGYAPLLRSLGQDLGFVQLAVAGCAILYAATLLVDPAGIRAGGISFLSPSLRSLRLFGASGAVPVFGEGHWWTVLSAAWLHGGLLHILFNMMWVRQLGPATAEQYGTARLVIIYTLSSISGFMLSSWRGTFFTIGASAPIFGLLGALVYVGRRGSTQVGRQAWSFAVILFVFGLLMPRVDNWGHIGGFVGGYLAGKWLDPLKPEGMDHYVLALICLLLTALSVLLSVVLGWESFRIPLGL